VEWLGPLNDDDIERFVCTNLGAKIRAGDSPRRVSHERRESDVPERGGMSLVEIGRDWSRLVKIDQERVMNDVGLLILRKKWKIWWWRESDARYTS